MRREQAGVNGSPHLHNVRRDVRSHAQWADVSGHPVSGDSLRVCLFLLLLLSL
jgi:hypothetical protein